MKSVLSKGLMAIVLLAPMWMRSTAGLSADLPDAAARGKAQVAGTPTKKGPPIIPMSPRPKAAEMKGIWAAIAYSDREGRHGFFWGADKKDEAESVALDHCRSAGGETCAIVAVFRNHRHWDDDDETSFPYHPCGVLAVDGSSSRAWAAISTHNGAAAEDLALKQCRRSGTHCEVRERVCT